MATATSVSLNIWEEQTKRVPIADFDHARLMYYLKCMSALGPRPGGDPSLKAPARLTDHANYQLLSFQEIREVAKWCYRLAPDNPKLTKFAVCDTQGEACKDPSKSDCGFISISADCDVVSIGRRSIVASSVKGVGERLVMWYTAAWLEEFYTNPLKIVSIFHCFHCSGVEDLCPCAEGCDRPAKSQCLLLRSNEHRFICDGCADERWVTGVLYLCTVCTNYGLCRRCYFEREVDDLTHAYEEFVSRGATPRRLAPRKTPWSPLPPPVSSQSISSIKDIFWGRSFEPARTPSQPSTTQPYDSNFGLPSPAIKNSSPKITLANSAGPPQSKAKVPFAKNDAVVLKGLTKAEMNGKEATVLSVDVAAQKVQIQVVGMEKTFKVKWSNVELLEELDVLEEELQ